MSISWELTYLETFEQIKSGQTGTWCIQLCLFLVDINECRLPTTRCPYGCVNDVGSYHCNCANGFNFNHRTKTCEGNRYSHLV